MNQTNLTIIKIPTKSQQRVVILRQALTRVLSDEENVISILSPSWGIETKRTSETPPDIKEKESEKLRKEFRTEVDT